MFSGDARGWNIDDYATFSESYADTGEQSVRLGLPLNGVQWNVAKAYCQYLGKDLPTEAMFEFVASGLGKELNYVWGMDPPECGDAVIARSGFGVYMNFAGTCRLLGTVGGPEPPGNASRDRVQIGDESENVVVDLAGNVAEWTDDRWRQQDEIPRDQGPLHNPVDHGSPDEPWRVVKGGSWRGWMVEARAGARRPMAAAEANRTIGFRCARAAGDSETSGG